jgi:hypothetical protein
VYSRRGNKHSKGILKTGAYKLPHTNYRAVVAIWKFENYKIMAKLYNVNFHSSNYANK